MEAVDLKSDADQTQEPGVVICVQIVDGALQAVRQAIDDMELLQFSILEQNKVEEIIDRVRAMVITYDGPRGAAKRFIAGLVSKRADLPILVILPTQFQNENIKPRSLRALGLFKWPRDAARFSAQVYDLSHENEEEADADEQEQEDYGFDLSESKQVTKLEEVAEPARESDHTVLQFCQREIENRRKLAAEMKELREVNEHFFIGRVLVFHPDPAGVEGLRRHLRSGGMPNLVSASSISKVFHHLRGENVTLLTCWYDKDRDHALELLAEINAARTIRPMAIAVVTPGETATLAFIKDAKALIYDRVLAYEKSPAKLTENLKQAIKLHRSADSLSGSLFRIRAACRHALPGSRRKPIAEDKKDELFKPLRGAPGKEYWVDAEEVLQALLNRDRKLAADLSAKLGKKRLDAILLCATVKVIFEGAKQAGEWLVDKALSHRELNLERCYIFGRSLYRWGAKDSMQRLLLEWHNRDDLAVDHQFYYILSCYWDLCGQTDRQFRYLGKSLSQSPLRDEYLYSLLRFYEKKRDTRRLEDVWRVLLATPGVNQVAAKFHLAKLLNSLQKRSGAADLLREVLEAKPGYEPAENLLAKIVGH